MPEKNKNNWSSWRQSGDITVEFDFTKFFFDFSPVNFSGVFYMCF